MTKDYKGRTHTELRKLIVEAESNLSDLKAALSGLTARCQHNWSNPEYTPEIHEGYQIQGDPVGTMGVDWRGPSWVDRQEIKRWTRTCYQCGKSEITEQTRDKVEKVPVFSDRRG